MSISNPAAGLLIAVLSAGSVFAQSGGFEGLDLSDDPPKKEEPKKPPPNPDEGLDLSGDVPAKPKVPKERKPVEQKKPEDAANQVGERDVTQEDRVKSVQRKLYMKRGRFELAPYFIVNVNDPYYAKFGGAIRAAFHPADSLAISARFSLMQTLPTDDVRIAKKNLGARIFFSVPIWSVMGDLEWSPFYGKVSIFNTILHLDGYLIAGGGVVFTQTSGSPDVDKAGVKPAFDLGVGLRFVAKDFFAVNVALINTTYVDAPLGTIKSSTQNLMMLHAGVSIFFPFKSTFREAE